VPQKTHSVQRPIGVRRAPQPQGLPGYVRVDSVQQGDRDGLKGVYHINAVDTVTQWQVVAAVERISEQHLLPALRAVLEGFPFIVRGFHADNGSEYINHQVAALLNKLNIEFTKSRPRHCNDNALAEAKNGAIVRKHLGYTHIPSRFAALVNAFTLDVLTPYVNFHRPCFFPRLALDAKGAAAADLPLRGHDDSARQTRQPHEPGGVTETRAQPRHLTRRGVGLVRQRGGARAQPRQDRAFPANP
jgi:hypothetical protein